MKKILVAAVALLTSGSAFAADYTIDPSHSSVGFSIRHMMVSNVRGEFQKFQGEVSIDDKDLTRTKVDVTIDAASINTRDAKRDEHLRSPDFFDTAKYPTITFKSKKVAKAGKGKLKITGDLTMHGVTKPVVLDVEGPTAAVKNPWGKMVRGATATATINRKDFGLGWNQALETGGVLVGEEVKIELEVELVEKAPAEAKK